MTDSANQFGLARFLAVSVLVGMTIVFCFSSVDGVLFSICLWLCFIFRRMNALNKGNEEVPQPFIRAVHSASCFVPFVSLVFRTEASPIDRARPVPMPS